MEKPANYGGQNKIRSYRLRAEIGTQKELAKKTGLSQSIISDLERGRRCLTPAWAMLIAEAVGTPWRVLLEEAMSDPTQRKRSGETKSYKQGSRGEVCE